MQSLLIATLRASIHPKNIKLLKMQRKGRFLDLQNQHNDEFESLVFVGEEKNDKDMHKLSKSLALSSHSILNQEQN